MILIIFSIGVGFRSDEGPGLVAAHSREVEWLRIQEAQGGDLTCLLAKVAATLSCEEVGITNGKSLGFPWKLELFL